MSLSSEILKAIRILALNKALRPDYEYSYRRICRWYSREFSTPLTDVYDLAEEEVLQTYFEDSYDKLANGDTEENKIALDALKKELVDPVKEEDVAAEEAQDAAWEQEMIKEIQAQEKVDPSKDLEQAEKPNLNSEISQHFNEDFQEIHKEFDDIPDFE